ASLAGDGADAALHENAQPPLASIERVGDARRLISRDDMIHHSRSVLVVHADEIRRASRYAVAGAVDSEIRDRNACSIVHPDLCRYRFARREADGVSDDSTGRRRDDGLIGSTNCNTLERKTLVN